MTSCRQTSYLRESESNFTRAPAGYPHEVSWTARLFNYENNEMTIASDFLQQHIQTLD